MTIFEKNMQALQRRYPALAGAVESSSGHNYQVVLSSDSKLPTMVWNGDTESLFFYEPADPLGHIKSTLGDLRLERALVVVMLGLGLGYPLNVLFPSLRNPSLLRKIIVVEKDIECLRRAMETLDLSDALSHQQVKLVIGCKAEDLYVNLWEAIAPEFGGLKAIKFVPWPASIHLAPDYYLGAKKAIRDVAQSFMAERGNDPYDTLVGYENFFDNLPQYLANPGLHHVKDLLPGRPAVVVAAGPSLNNNVHLLRMLERRAVILSADASLKVLYKQGIYPHFVTTVERTPGIEHFFEGVSGLEQTVLAVASFTYPQTLASYAGPFLFMHRQYQFYEILGIDEDCFEMGGTTAHCAFALARYMGCNPIIFIGQDLAFGPDGVTHADGCAFGQRQAYAAEAGRIEIPANMGGVIETCPLWLRLLREYERTLSGFEGLAVNATEGGARIRGTQVMTFRQAIDEYCREEFNPREVVMGHLTGEKSSVSPKVISEGLERLVREADEVLQKSHAILEVISPVLRQVEAVDVNIPPDLSEKLFQASRDLNRLADELMTAPIFKAAGEYFMSVWVPLLLEWQVVADRFVDRAWAEAYRLSLGEEGFGAIGQLCLSLLDVLGKARKKIETLWV